MNRPLARLTLATYLMSQLSTASGVMGTIGPRLRAAREARNLTIEQAAQDTRISLRFLEALEREDFDELPAPVYVRGFLRSYGNYLGLEPQSLLDELDGGGAVATQRPAPSPAARQASDPFRRPTHLVPVPPHEPPAEWDPQLNNGEEYEPTYEEEPADYRPRPVAGVLVERGYQGDNRLPGLVVAIGAGVIAVLVLIVAVLALRGGGDDGGVPIAGDTTATATNTSGATVITVGSATPEGDETPGTPPPGETATAGTGQPTATSAPGSTPTATTEDSAEVTATATATAAPTLTPTPPPPTATPTATVTPSPTPTVQAHPFELSECTAGGGTNCGTPPYRVICAPDGWFVDKDGDYPKPADWFEFTVTSTFGIDSVANSTCP